MRSAPTRMNGWASLRRLGRRLLRAPGWRWFRGEYEKWDDARAASRGYDDASILAKVVVAAREVRAGRALWDRDGSTFTEPWLNEPLLAVLRRIAEAQGGSLDLVDFGGGLGSTWWQHRDALGEVLRWRVVEQPTFVAAGAEFANEVLSFHASLDDVQRGRPSSAILLSGVLQYLEDPLALLRSLSELGFEHAVIDRTPFVMAGADRLVVQHVPPHLGGGSYPSWLFTRARLLDALGGAFELKGGWLGFDEIDSRVEHRGLYAQRRA